MMLNVLAGEPKTRYMGTDTQFLSVEAEGIESFGVKSRSETEEKYPNVVDLRKHVINGNLTNWLFVLPMVNDFSGK